MESHPNNALSLKNAAEDLLYLITEPRVNIRFGGVGGEQGFGGEDH